MNTVCLNKYVLFLFCGFAALTGCQTGDQKKTPTEEERLTDKELRELSETMGHYLVENLYSQHIKLDIASLIQGIRDAEAGKTPPLDKQNFFQELTKYREQIMREIAADNLKAAEEFLSNNKSESGVVNLKDGKLQYMILKEGKGPQVSGEGTPLIHYEGKLLDGKVFEDSEKRGKHVPMPLKATFPGFKEGVAGMKEGEKRRIFIHPELGFGSAGPLPPNSMLIFDVTVIEAEAKKEEPETEKKEEQKPAPEPQKQDKDTGYKWIKNLKEKLL